MVRHEAHLLQLVVGGLISAKNPKVQCAGLAYATGLGALNGLGNQHQFAKANGVSRQSISKSNRFWKKTLGLGKSPHQKTEEACETYSKSQKEKHWRKQKATAAALSAKLKGGAA